MRRFLSPKPQLSGRELTYLTDVDHVTHEALAAFDSRGQIVAVARYAAWRPDSLDAAEIAVTVLDSLQRRGIGSALAGLIVERAEANGFARLTASTFWENVAARSLGARLGFRFTGSANGIVDYQLQLAPREGFRPEARPCPSKR